MFDQNEIQMLMTLACGAEVSKEFAGLVVGERGEHQSEVVDRQQRVAVSECKQQLDRVRQVALVSARIETKVLESRCRSGAACVTVASRRSQVALPAPATPLRRGRAERSLCRRSS